MVRLNAFFRMDAFSCVGRHERPISPKVVVRDDEDDLLDNFKMKDVDDLMIENGVEDLLPCQEMPDSNANTGDHSRGQLHVLL